MRRRLHWTGRLGWRRALSLLWLLALGAAAALAGLLPDYYLTPDLLHSNAPPLTSGHWLGTDPLGQDVWAALLYGTRTALLVSLPAAGLAAGLGTGLGLLAGYWGNTRLRFALAHWLAAGCAAVSYCLFEVPGTGLAAAWWPLALGSAMLLLGKLLLRLQFLRRRPALPLDGLLLAAITLLAAVPRLLLVLAVAAAFEPTLAGLVVLLTLTSWTQTARLVRAEVQRARRLPFLDAAHMAGLPPWRIMWYHLLPNTWLPIITALPLSIAALIALETTLSFLGVGLPPEVPSWGRLLALSRLAPSSWWLLVFPSVCLLTTTLALRHLLPTSKSYSLK
ncbi:MAG: ABC transporter permease [Hymenobacter sp.]|nr:ABC transporter permease [Hymenobacter sp.]